MKKVNRQNQSFSQLAGIALALAAAAILAGCLNNDTGSTYSATIRYTSYGVPHVKAENFKGAGYGYGYAFAKENICLFAEELVTLRGERSKYFGGAGTYTAQLDAGTLISNTDSDFFYRLVLDSAQAEAIRANSSQAAQDLAAGFVAGYNRYLRDTGLAALPVECRDAAWVTPMTETEAYLHFSQAAMAGSSLQFINYIGGTQPPAATRVALRSSRQRAATLAQASLREQARNSPFILALQTLKQHKVGSNGLALGRDATESGKGLLLGNPHFPWWGALRLNQVHLTVTGENYDVYGSTLLGVPLPLIGFNGKVAWTHTFSTDNRFVLRVLTIDPADPKRYMKDGVSKAMTVVPLTITTRANDGTETLLSRTMYKTEYGPMVTVPGLFPWSATQGFAIQDANATNYKLIDQVILNGKATSVESLRQAAATYTAMPWVNTMAADVSGDVLYANYSVAANVSDAQVASCLPAAYSFLLDHGVFPMTGSSAACDWSGAVPAAERPYVERTDYILNANDSHWWPSMNTFLTGYRKIIATGPDAEGKVQNNRTRTGHALVRDRLAGKDGLAGNRFTMANLQQIYSKSRFFVAEKWLPDFVTTCLASSTASAAAKDACKVLQAWDTTHGFDSSGAVLFMEFYEALGSLVDPSWWAIPFNPADPLETPRDTANAAKALALLETLVNSPQFDTAAKRRLSPKDVQIVKRSDVSAGQLSVPGGRYTFNNWTGVKTETTPGNFIYSGTSAAAASAAAGKPINGGLYGNSYIQFVTWDGNGPVAEGILSYGQSSNPASAHFNDLTKKYAAGEWVKLPYTEAQITADANYSVMAISE